MKIRAKTLTDEPTVSMRDAGLLFGMGRDKFRENWDEVYKWNVRHVKTTHGWRILLTDLIKEAYPGIPKRDMYMLAQDFLWRQMKYRREVPENGKDGGNDK